MGFILDAEKKISRAQAERVNSILSCVYIYICTIHIYIGEKALSPSGADWAGGEQSMRHSACLKLSEINHSAARGKRLYSDALSLSLYTVYISTSPSLFSSLADKTV